jgi:hypothetical protein
MTIAKIRIIIKELVKQVIIFFSYDRLKLQEVELQAIIINN